MFTKWLLAARINVLLVTFCTRHKWILQWIVVFVLEQVMSCSRLCPRSRWESRPCWPRKRSAARDSWWSSSTPAPCSTTSTRTAPSASRVSEQACLSRLNATYVTTYMYQSYRATQSTWKINGWFLKFTKAKVRAVKIDFSYIRWCAWAIVC